MAQEANYFGALHNLQRKAKYCSLGFYQLKSRGFYQLKPTLPSSQWLHPPFLDGTGYAGLQPAPSQHPPSSPGLTCTTGASFTDKWERMVWEGAVRAAQYRCRSPLLRTRCFWLMFCPWFGSRDNTRSPGAANCPVAGHLAMWSSASCFGLRCSQAEFEGLQGQSISLREGSSQVWRSPGSQGTVCDTEKQQT